MPFSIFTQKGIQVYALCGTLVNLGICATAA